MNENTEDKSQPSILRLAFILEAVLDGQLLLPIETALSMQPSSSNDNAHENSHHYFSLKGSQIEADLIEALFLYLHIEQLRQHKFNGIAQIDDPLLMPLCIYLQNSLTQKNLFHTVWDRRINIIEQFDTRLNEPQDHTDKSTERNSTGFLDEAYFKSLFLHDGKSLRAFFHRVSFTLDECARLPTLIDLQLPLLRAFKHLQLVTLQILKSDDVMHMVCSHARENYFRLVGLIAMGWMALKIAKAIDHHKRLDTITTKFPTPLLSTLMVDSLHFMTLILPETEMHHRILTIPLNLWQKILPRQ